MKTGAGRIKVVSTLALVLLWMACNSGESQSPTGPSPVLPPLPPLPAPSPTSTSRQSPKPRKERDGRKPKDDKKPQGSKRSDRGNNEGRDDSRHRDDDGRKEESDGGDRSSPDDGSRDVDDTDSGSFVAELEIEREASRFEVEGALGLRKDSDGIDPLAEDVVLEVGVFSATILAGSFELTHATPLLRFEFDGTVDGVNLEMTLRVLDNVVLFEAEVEDADLEELSGPVTVTFGIGNDTATTTVTVGEP